MAVSRDFFRSSMARGSLAAIVLPVIVLSADRAGAEIISKEDALRGIRVIPQFFAEATDKRHQGAPECSVIAMAGCASGTMPRQRGRS